MGLFDISVSSPSKALNLPTHEVQTHCALVFHTINGETVVTRHNIHSDRLGKGVPIHGHDVLALCATQKSTSQSQGLLPHRVLKHTHHRLVWHSKAQQRLMWFRQGQPISFNVWWPAMLWVLTDQQQLNLFALGSNRRPNENTRLYRVPLMNISANGAVCLGSATLPDECTPANLAEMERCIFDSNFSHLNGANPAHGKHMGDNAAHIAFWRSRHNKPQKINVADLHFIGRVSDLHL